MLEFALNRNPFELCLVTFAVCVASGFVPLVNAELFLLAASAVLPLPLALPVVAAAAVGQLVAKSAMYYAARGMIRLPGRWDARRVALQARARTHGGAGATLVFASAAAGVPPFYLTSIASGAMHMRFRTFAVAGLCGRFLRFGLIVLAPQLLKGIL